MAHDVLRGAEGEHVRGCAPNVLDGLRVRRDDDPVREEPDPVQAPAVLPVLRPARVSTLRRARGGLRWGTHLVVPLVDEPLAVAHELERGERGEEG